MMSKKELLLNKMKENNGIITTKDALSLGIHKDTLKKTYAWWRNSKSSERIIRLN